MVERRSDGPPKSRRMDFNSLYHGPSHPRQVHSDLNAGYFIFQSIGERVDQKVVKGWITFTKQVQLSSRNFIEGIPFLFLFL